MPENALIEAWRNAARELELKVTPWRVVLLPSAKCLVADLWVDGFGSPRGVLLFGRAEQIEQRAEELQREHWAYTVLDAESDSAPTREQIMHRLRGWGWYGAPDAMPGWLIGV